MISALKVNFRCWKNVVMSRVLYQNFGTCGVHTIMILYHMAVWHDTKAALGTQAAASTNRDSIWYPALALEAIRLIQYTGPDGSRVVKLLASGTVLSSHWLTRGELMWDTATFFPHKARAGRNHSIHSKGPESESLHSESRRKPTHWHNCIGVLNRNERFMKAGIYIKTYRCPFEQL